LFNPKTSALNDINQAHTKLNNNSIFHSFGYSFNFQPNNSPLGSSLEYPWLRDYWCNPISFKNLCRK